MMKEAKRPQPPILQNEGVERKSEGHWNAVWKSLGCGSTGAGKMVPKRSDIYILKREQELGVRKVGPHYPPAKGTAPTDIVDNFYLYLKVNGTSIKGF